MNSGWQADVTIHWGTAACLLIKERGTSVAIFIATDILLHGLNMPERYKKAQPASSHSSNSSTCVPTCVSLPKDRGIKLACAGLFHSLLLSCTCVPPTWHFRSFSRKKTQMGLKLKEKAERHREIASWWSVTMALPFIGAPSWWCPQFAVMKTDLIISADRAPTLNRTLIMAQILLSYSLVSSRGVVDGVEEEGSLFSWFS